MAFFIFHFLSLTIFHKFWFQHSTLRLIFLSSETNGDIFIILGDHNTNNILYSWMLLSVDTLRCLSYFHTRALLYRFSLFQNTLLFNRHNGTVHCTAPHCTVQVVIWISLVLISSLAALSTVQEGHKLYKFVCPIWKIINLKWMLS